MFRHPADRLPVLLVLVLFAVDITVYLAVDSVFLLLLYAWLSMYPKAGVCAFNHHHQHLTTFTSALPNRLLEIVYALQTGVSSQAWVLHHVLGHHLHYLDQEQDESRWKREDGTAMGKWEYALSVTLTAYPRAWAVGAKYQRIRRVFLVMGLITMGIVIALLAFRPLPALVIFVLTPAIMLYGTALATYGHHAGRETDDHLEASNNILQPFYNALTGNLGYHTAHHFKPGVHWSQLPELHGRLADRIPGDAYVEPGWPWRLFGSSDAPTPSAREHPST